MAPTAPKKRPVSRRPSAGSGAGTSSGASTIANRIPHKSHDSGSAFPSTKKDKRITKHSTFVSRITKAHSKPLKRRRPSKKLVTTLESLGDVLGELEHGLEAGAGSMSRSGTGGPLEKKSLKSRPGAMKRKEKVEKMERERFRANMAQMVAGTKGAGVGVDVGMGEGEKSAQVEGQGEAKNATSGRWAALRGFLEQTMERKEEFKKG